MAEDKKLEIDYEASKKRANKVYEEEILPAQEQEEAEAREEFSQYIETEEEFLSFFSEERYNLKVLYGDKIVPFKVKPVESGDDLSYMDVDIDIYADLNSKEQKVIEKVGKGEKLRKGEQKLYERIMKRQAQKATGHVNDMLVKLLARHVTPPSFDTVEEREKFWETSPVDLRTFLGTQVMGVLGIDRRNTVQLFRDD